MKNTQTFYLDWFSDILPFFVMKIKWRNLMSWQTYSGTSMAVYTLCTLLLLANSVFGHCFCFALHAPVSYCGIKRESKERRKRLVVQGCSDWKRWRLAKKQRKDDWVGTERAEPPRNCNNEAETVGQKWDGGRIVVWLCNGEHRWDRGISCLFPWESGHLAWHPQVPASVAIN